MDLRRVKAVHLEVKGKPYSARTELVDKPTKGFGRRGGGAAAGGGAVVGTWAC